MVRSLPLSLALSTLVLGACGDPSEVSSLGILREAGSVSNGRNLNGRNLNGRNLNGRNLNGRNLNGRNLNGRNLNGRNLNGRNLNGRWLEGGPEVDALELQGSELVAISGPSTLRGTDVEGLILTLGEGTVLRLDSAIPDPLLADGWQYTVSVQTPNGWTPVCGEDEDGVPVPAYALAGSWDYRQGVPGGGDHLAEPGFITLACQDGALGKCVGLGYAPWRSATLQEHHQACTRMMRADYCGDGRSFTQDGVWINVFDGLGIQLDTESWDLEAEWDAQGARCTSQRRRTSANGFPTCSRIQDAPNCGEVANFGSGTLLITESYKQ